MLGTSAVIPFLRRVAEAGAAAAIAVHAWPHVRPFATWGIDGMWIATLKAGKRTTRGHRQEKLIEHEQCIPEHGEEMPEVRDWKGSERGSRDNPETVIRWAGRCPEEQH